MKLSIDLIENASDIETYKDEKKLPSGITKKMLTYDVLKIAGPSFIELVLTQITSMVDLMMIGSVGTWAISAISLTTQPKFLMMTLFTSLNVGTTALVARYRGINDQNRANEVLRQAIFFTIAVAILMSIVGYLASEPLMRFMGAEDTLTLSGAITYFKIQMVGLLPLALTTTITAGLRGIGDSKTAMIYNTVANATNFVLNWLLINGNLGFPALGVAGASIATIVGQLIAFLMAVYYLMQSKTYFKLSFYFGNFDGIIFKNLLRIGFPSMIQQILMRLGMIMYARTVASLGTVDFVTHNICMNIQTMSFIIGQAFGTSTTALTGQCLGKKRVDIAKRYMNISVGIGLAISLLLAFLFIFCGEFIMSLYTGDAIVISTGVEILMLLAAIQPFQSVQFIYSGGLSGAGDSKAIAIVIFITIVVIRPGIAELLVTYMYYGLYGAWIALALDQLIRSILIFLRYRSGKWMYIRFNGI